MPIGTFSFSVNDGVANGVYTELVGGVVFDEYPFEEKLNSTGEFSIVFEDFTTEVRIFEATGGVRGEWVNDENEVGTLEGGISTDVFNGSYTLQAHAGLDSAIVASFSIIISDGLISGSYVSNVEHDDEIVKPTGYAAHFGGETLFKVYWVSGTAAGGRCIGTLDDEGTFEGAWSVHNEVSITIDEEGSFVSTNGGILNGN
ncbi:MAG: hypothetical protein RJQ09_16295 [Cyclobacteriaceae bacterium]